MVVGVGLVWVARWGCVFSAAAFVEVLGARGCIEKIGVEHVVGRAPVILAGKNKGDRLKNGRLPRLVIADDHI